MSYSLKDEKVEKTLARLHNEASGDFLNMSKAVFSRMVGKKFLKQNFSEAYFAISQDKGEFIYTLLRGLNSKNMVEFGTSFGISTLYLAAAARDNGGKVIASEIVPEKCRKAEAHFAEAGLSDYIELREGDGLKTLSQEIPKPIDFLFLDGWKDAYLPVFKMLEPQFRVGTCIVADNAALKDATPYIEHVRSDREHYMTHFIRKDAGGMEFTTCVKT